jgi:micrococcal nuclease
MRSCGVVRRGSGAPSTGDADTVSCPREEPVARTAVARLCVFVAVVALHGAASAETWEERIAAQVGRVEAAVQRLDGQTAPKGSLALRLTVLDTRIGDLEAIVGLPRKETKVPTRGTADELLSKWTQAAISLESRLKALEGHRPDTAKIRHDALPPVPDLPRPDFSRLEKGRVEHVIDGDTVRVLRRGASITMRLIGVDTPETVDPRKPVEAYGREAATFLRNLVEGEEVWVDHNAAETLDKYSRELAYLYRVPDGLSLNAEIIRQGYGHAMVEFPHPLMGPYRTLEARARLLHKGLWAPASEEEATPPPSTGPPPHPTPPRPAGPATPAPLVSPPPAATPPTPERETKDVTVYVTRTGAKYHRAGCQYLKSSSIPMPLSKARESYSPCSRCRPPE